MGFFSKFLLLTAKNFMVMGRSIAWTICELLVPTILGFLICLLLGIEFIEPLRIPGSDGTTATVNAYVGPTFGMYSYLGQTDHSEKLKGVDRVDVNRILYSRSSEVSQSDVDEFAQFFDQNDRTFEMTPSSSREEVLRTLKDQRENYITFYGVHFTKLDQKTASLSYEVYVCNDKNMVTLDVTWEDESIITGKGGTAHPYMHLQQRLDALFIEFSNAGETLRPIIAFHMPKESRLQSLLIQLTITAFPWVVLLMMLPTVIHTAREIAAERESGMKDFLAVVGVSPPVFFFSHVFIGWLKGLIIVTLSSIFFLYKLNKDPNNVNMLVMLLLLYLFVLATVCFAALVATMFKTTGTVVLTSIVLYGAHVAVYAIPFLKPDSTRTVLCFVQSLNFVAAFGNGIAAAEKFGIRGRPMGFTTFFEDVPYFFNLGPAMLMLLVDAAWMLALVFFFDFVRSKTNFSLSTYLCCCFRREFGGQTTQAVTVGAVSVEDSKSKSQRGTVKEDASSVESGKSMATNPLSESQEANDSKTPIDINVENLVKVWSTGERAVDGMNLQAHRGQVTVLLGHNGAGKSTTFSVIAGTTPASSGIVNVDSNIGLCPQGNAIFNTLTVAQHLWFFNKIKGARGPWRPEGMQLMGCLDMVSKINCQAKFLSGGQKRKLCLMMALIGNSRVVLLDEPTAGMDTGARADVKRMLEIAKKERTILLTTHYMDEAEALGDTISIMVRGKNVAGGSPQFLKKRFGTGYILTVVLLSNEVNVKEMADKVLKVITNIVPTATLQSCQGKQMTIILPTDQQAKFAELFGVMEGEQQNLGVESFGVSLDTLEHVFLRVGELAEKHVETTSSRSSAAQVYDASMDEKISGVGHLFFQFGSLLRKRFVYGYRNWSEWIFQILFPVAIMCLLMGGKSYSGSERFAEGRTMNMENLDDLKVVISVSKDYEKGEFYERITKTLKNTKNVLIENIAYGTNREKTIAKLAKLPRRMPPVGLALIFHENGEQVFINTLCVHVIPAYQNLYANSRMSKGSIQTKVRGYRTNEKTMKDKTSSDKTGKPFTSVTIIFCFTFIVSAFSSFIVLERVTKFAHQQFLTGVSSVIYWTATLLYDTLIYTVVCGMLVGAFMLGKTTGEQIGWIIFAMAILYFATMSLVYCTSFMFSTPSKAKVLLFVWLLVASCGFYVIIYVSRMLITAIKGEEEDGTYYTAMTWVQDVFYLVFPLLPFSEAYHEATEMWPGGKPSRNFWKAIIQMSICAGIFIPIFVICRIRPLRRLCSGKGSCCGTNPIQCLMTPDPDVKAEKDFVLQNSGKFVLEVNSLSKNYGSHCALNELTFGVLPKECFGLLGTNGAGKTTTFGILTGEQFASSGEARINGKCVQRSIVPMGYCPQFDAMLPDLTGRECLEIFASLIGYANPKGKTEIVLEAVLMEEHADKRFVHYSGGQKRKISVGVALLAQTTLTILDEPTAGIDPKARREVWSFLSMVREHDNSALLLTSHSMDECEAICTKIAIMVKGEMVAVGTSQHLKSKYSNSYLLTLILGDPQKEGELKLRGDFARKEALTRFPGSVERTDFTNERILKFMIPKRPDDKWSVLWQTAKQVSETAACKDYSITQSTLTETFLELQRETTNAAVKYV